MSTLEYRCDDTLGDGGADIVDGGTSPAFPCQSLLLLLVFTDIVGSTQIAERLGNDAWRALLDRHRAAVRSQLAGLGGREVDCCGDGFFAVFDRPGRAIRCAEGIRRAISELGIQIRAGIHAGECLYSDGRVTGLAVHVAARILALARPGEVLVSDTVRDLVSGSGLAFSDCGRYALKGVSGSRHLFALGGGQSNNTSLVRSWNSDAQGREPSIRRAAARLRALAGLGCVLSGHSVISEDTRDGVIFNRK